MPIYAYRCDDCGHAKDVLQKLSDPVLSVCPSCGTPSFRKQVTAAGFQLKGSGWYVTDFRGGNAAAAKADGAKADGAAGDAKTESKTADATPAAPAATATATASSGDGKAASGGCGAACACH